MSYITDINPECITINEEGNCSHCNGDHDSDDCPQQIEKELRQTADRLAELAGKTYDSDDARPDSPSAQLRRAQYAIENAVGELMECAAKQYGREIVPGSVQVLREVQSCR